MLLVDDQDQVRRMARLVIEAEVGSATEGLVVIEASGGEQAIAMCSGQRIDVVVLDIHMPSVDGLDVLKAVKALPEPPCVVAWSADELAVRRAIEIGAELGV